VRGLEGHQSEMVFFRDGLAGILNEETDDNKVRNN
jgi:hypothetical protein